MIEQGTREWLEARLGKLTASRISSAMMKPTTKGYQDYQAELITERLSGQPTENFVSEAMMWGTECEPQARAMYELTCGVDVEQVGFVDHPTIAMAGASPDGLVGERGLVEIKCPNSATHIRTLLTGSIDQKYMNQMYWQMECTGRDWCDFVSFDPRLPAEVQFYSRRVEADHESMGEMRESAKKFLTETQDMTERLMAKMQEAA